MAEFFQKLNWIDLLIVILLIRSSYVGFTKGFGWELFRFIGYICAAIGAIYYYEFLSQLISDYVPTISPFSNLLSFTAFYIIILIIFKFVNLLIEKIIKIEIFSTLERLGGLLFGLARGSVLLSLLLITLMLTQVPYFDKSIKERSSMGRTVLEIAPFLYEKTAVVFPALKFGQRNEALSKLTGLNEGLPLLGGAKDKTKQPKKGLLKGDIGQY